MVGESTKGESFLVVRESIRNIWLVLDSTLFSAPVEKNVQFSPNLDQNYKTLYFLILRKDFFKFKHLSMMGQNKLTEVTIVNFPKKTASGQFVQNLCSLVFSDPL